MSPLGWALVFGAIFPHALAAPLSVPDVVSDWVPANLKVVQQIIYDFLNPYHSPSVTQAIISCTLLLFFSSITAGPTVIPVPKDFSRSQALFLRIQYIVYGLLAPDFLAITSSFKRIDERYSALVYNRLYNKDAPKKFKWTMIHGAFVNHGGFVLWEDDKPAKVLHFKDILRMVKSGEIELPPLSKKDILARSTRAPGFITAWLLPLPIYWFTRKFTRVLPIYTLLVVMHSWLSWYAYYWRTRTIVAVVEPIVLFPKPREMKELISDITADDIEKDPSQTSDDSEKDADASVIDSLNSADLSEKTIDSDDQDFVAPVNKSKVLRFLLALGVVYVVLSEILKASSLAITSPMRVQWRVVSKTRDPGLRLGCYIIGTITTLVGWIAFCFRFPVLPFPSEVERPIWSVSSFFITLQPFILLLAPRWIRSKVWGSVKRFIWIIYNLAYAAARISVIFIAVHSVKSAA